MSLIVFYDVHMRNDCVLSWRIKACIDCMYSSDEELISVGLQPLYADEL